MEDASYKRRWGNEVLEQNRKKFEQFVSLGYSCPVAASMGKYGLRSWSGVFDWLVTESSFGMVLHYIENDFEDFLLKENLELYAENPTYFIDKVSGFYFVHDGFLVEEEFDKLQNKYNQRISNFITKTSKPTCFLRYVNNAEEMNYIVENQSYIDQVIKKNNSQSEIWFLMPEEIEMEEFPFVYFKIKGPYSGKNKAELRGLFDKNIDFLECCVERAEPKRLVQNLMFDYEKERRMESIIKDERIIERRYQLALQMHLIDWTSLMLPKTLRIFGGGNIGRIFAKNIKDRCMIESFIDNDTEKYGTYVDGIIVNALARTDFSKKIPIVVTAVYDFERICEDIKKYDKDAIVLSLDDVLENRAVF